MEKLIEKLIEDRLTPEELKRLREFSDKTSDQDFERLLRHMGENTTSDIEADEECIRRMKRVIDEKTGRRQLMRRVWQKRVAAIAASLIIIAIVGGIIFMSKHNRSGDAAMEGNQLLSVAVEGTGPTAVSLSDGTTVDMGGGANMSYPKEFDRDVRRVNFSGRAYFKVSSDSLCPFEIITPEMTVRVPGTSFSLITGTSSGYAELCLDEGTVRITSLKTKESVYMTAGNIARIDPADGHIDICRTEINGRLDWQNGELRFSDISPDSLIERIESVYGRKLATDVAACINGNFTGTLPADDFPTAMAILGRIYKFPVKDGKE